MWSGLHPSTCLGMPPRSWTLSCVVSGGPTDIRAGPPRARAQRGRPVTGLKSLRVPSPPPPRTSSNVAVNAWLPQASYPCGNFSDQSRLVSTPVLPENRSRGQRSTARQQMTHTLTPDPLLCLRPRNEGTHQHIAAQSHRRVHTHAHTAAMARGPIVKSNSCSRQK